MKVFWKEINKLDPAEIQVGDWVEGVGEISTEWELAFVRKAIRQLQSKCGPTLLCKGVPPRRAYEGDAGLDLRAAHDAFIQPMQIGFVDTGTAMAIPEGYFGMVAPRSGNTLRGLVAEIGIIDAGYRGEIRVILRNMTGEEYHVQKGQRVAQLVILPVWNGNILQVNTLPDSERGSNGFGSTGR